MRRYDYENWHMDNPRDWIWLLMQGVGHVAAVARRKARP